MGILTIEAGPLPLAHGWYNALAEFHAELTTDRYGCYGITVETGSDDARMVAVFDGIQAYVTGRDKGPALVELGGHRFTFHPQ